MLGKQIMNGWRLAAALALASLVGMAAAASVAAPAVSLPAYGADPGQTSVSGFSSGAFMAVQLQVAYSESFIGAGIIAGGPYYCAANTVAFAKICLGQVPLAPPNPALMANAARTFALQKRIDSLGNLSGRRIYVFSGADDSIVRQKSVDATVSFFRQVGVPAAHLKYVNNLPAGHAVITPSYGNDCASNTSPFISQCTIGSEGYDQAGEVLKHIYGESVIKGRVDKPAGEIIAFNQRPYASAATSMAAVGYLYVPRSCAAAGSRCKVHVAIHGCWQSAESVGKQFYTDTGYNHWADNNKLMVLYPQVNKSSVPYNPQGCWDWWGFTGANYAVKSGVQMKAIKAMVDRLIE